MRTNHGQTGVRTPRHRHCAALLGQLVVMPREHPDARRQGLRRRPPELHSPPADGIESVLLVERAVDDAPLVIGPLHDFCVSPLREPTPVPNANLKPSIVALAPGVWYTSHAHALGHPSRVAGAVRDAIGVLLGALTGSASHARTEHARVGVNFVDYLVHALGKRTAVAAPRRQMAPWTSRCRRADWHCPAARRGGGW